MPEIRIENQAEWDALPEKFDQYTQIYIVAKNKIYVGRAWENASVVARENASVEAWENASVEAWGRVSVQVFSTQACVLLFAFAIAIVAKTIKHRIKKKSKTSYIHKVFSLEWFELNGIQKTKNIVLFKRVSEDFKTQEGTKNETLWLLGSIVEHPNWKPERQECGAGKFHGVSRPYFADQFRGTKGDKYIAIRVALEDTYEWENPFYPHKIGFRKGKVLFECDRFGRKLKN